MLEKLDMFGYKQSLLVHGKSTGKTSLGGIMLIIDIIAMLGLLAYYGRTLFYKDSPIVLSTETYDPIMPPRQLTDDEFTFPFALEDPDFTPFYDPSYFTINATIVRIRQGDNGKINWEHKPLSYGACSKKKGQIFKTGINEEFLNTLSCADYNSHTYINSSYEYGDYNSLQFEFYPCKNGSGIICKPEKEIQRMLGNSILLGQYLDFVVIPEDNQNPVKWKVGNWFTAISINSFKQIEVFIKQYELSTDNGLIFNSVDTHNYLKVDEIKELYYNTPSTDGLFLRFIFRYSSNKTKMYRNYVKLQNVFVELGGFLKFLTFFSTIINYGFSKLTFYEMLSSSFLMSHNSSSSNVHFNKIGFESKSVRRFEDKVKVNESRTIKKSTIMNKVTLFEYISYIFCKCAISKEKELSMNERYVKIKEVNKLMDLCFIIPNILKVKELEEVYITERPNSHVNLKIGKE
jgi:hypothetical protein